MKPLVMVISASGTNRHHDAAWACELAGANTEQVHMSQLLGSENTSDILSKADMLLFAGGFSYGDALGAGKRWAFDLEIGLKEGLTNFVETGKPVIGICNGFQVLLKAGLLDLAEEQATLTHNENAKFECRWVYLEANKNTTCSFLKDLDELIYCPVAHGEGRVLANQDIAAERIAFSYTTAEDSKAINYPFNPNGSQQHIAGLCNEKGNVLGLMPHPENHVVDYHHPRWTRGEVGNKGLSLFEAAINYSKKV